MRDVSGDATCRLDHGSHRARTSSVGELQESPSSNATDEGILAIRVPSASA